LELKGKSPTSRTNREKWGSQDSISFQDSNQGPKLLAVIEVWVLVKPLAEAVMKKLPLVVLPATALRTFVEKVAMFWLLENQVATAVMSCPLLQEAVNVRLGSVGDRVVPLLATTMGALVQATETTRGWLPVIDGSMFDAAVTLPAPVLCAVTSPLLVTVAMA